MLGWMLVFLMMSVTAVLAGATHGVAFIPAAEGAGLVFGVLLLLSALTRILRGQA